MAAIAVSIARPALLARFVIPGKMRRAAPTACRYRTPRFAIIGLLTAESTGARRERIFTVTRWTTTVQLTCNGGSTQPEGGDNAADRKRAPRSCGAGKDQSLASRPLQSLAGAGNPGTPRCDRPKWRALQGINASASHGSRHTLAAPSTRSATERRSPETSSPCSHSREIATPIHGAIMRHKRKMSKDDRKSSA